jgi:hypothetical protein
MLVRQVRSDASAHGPLDFNDWRVRGVTGLYRHGVEAVACSNTHIRRDDLVLLLVCCLEAVSKPCKGQSPWFSLANQTHENRALCQRGAPVRAALEPTAVSFETDSK